MLKLRALRRVLGADAGVSEVAEGPVNLICRPLRVGH